MKPDRARVSGSLKADREGSWRWFLLALVLNGMATPAFADASLSLKILGSESPAEGPVPQDGVKVRVGDVLTIVLTVTNGKVSQAIQLPGVDGLAVNGSGTDPHATSEDLTFFVTPTRSGDVTIPAFDIHTDDGETLQVNAIRLHVTGP